MAFGFLAWDEDESCKLFVTNSDCRWTGGQIPWIGTRVYFQNAQELAPSITPVPPQSFFVLVFLFIDRVGIC